MSEDPPPKDPDDTGTGTGTGPDSVPELEEGRASSEVAPAATGLPDILGLSAVKEPWYRALLVPLLAVVTALAVGALIVLLSGRNVGDAYYALFTGSIGNPRQIVDAIGSGDIVQIRHAFFPLSETIVTATPLILAGLSVALGFRAGLFNIGAQGQIVAGGILAIMAAFSFGGLPGPIHLALIVLAGMAGGAVWGSIPGVLKAKTGAHEVITTIMLNFVAFRLSDYVLTTDLFQRTGSDTPVSKTSLALFPHLFGASLRVNAGIIVALIAAVLVGWLLNRTTWGFEFRAVGANPNAAKTAGMSPTRTYIVVMALAGALAGLAGAIQLSSVTPSLSAGLLQNVGFDAIALALLGRSRPGGVVAASFLFAALRTGGVNMQAATDVPIDLVTVIQAMVIMFVAAPALIRGLYRIRARRAMAPEAFTKGWSG